MAPFLFVVCFLAVFCFLFFFFRGRGSAWNFGAHLFLFMPGGGFGGPGTDFGTPGQHVGLGMLWGKFSDPENTHFCEDMIL